MKYIFLSMALALSGGAGLYAQCEGVPLTSNRLVNDGAHMLSSREAGQLESKLVSYDRETSTQIAIVTETSLQGGDDFERALCYFEAWGIGGSREKSNGVLIYVSQQDRKIRIMTGYGVEGFLPDAIAKRIIDNIITPAFRQGRYYDGFDRAADAIIAYGQGEYTNEGGDSKGNTIPFIIIIGFLLVIILVLGAISRHDEDDGDDGGYWRGGRYDDPDRTRRQRRSRGGWIFLPGGGGGWTSGGGGFGGGGFGGFGGGLTGGGGAGGSW